jgi:hypothetical protein
MGTVLPKRVYIRKAVKFCNILLDDSIRKPLVRLHFNGDEKLYIELIGANKESIPHDITSVDDIFTHIEAIRSTAKMYDLAKGILPEAKNF